MENVELFFPRITKFKTSAMNKLFTITGLFILKYCYSHKLVDLPPVFLIDIDGIWNDTETTSNPFTEIKHDDFYKTIQEGIKKFEMVIVFVENKLSVEDLSIKDEKGTPFTNLRQRILQGKAKYLPAVKRPYEAIASMLQPKYQNTFYLKSPNAPLNLPQGEKYFYILFEDQSDEPRASALRRHDEIIESVYVNTHQFNHNPVLAIYTGKINPAVVPHIDMIRYSQSELANPAFIVESQSCLVSLQGFAVAGDMRRFSSSHYPTVKDENVSEDKLTTKIAFMDYELQFDFKFRTSDWILDSVGLIEADEEIGRTEMGVGAPLGCSYRCADPLVIVNSRDGSDVTIAQYQIQPFLNKLTRRAVKSGNRLQGDDPPDESEPGFEAELKPEFLRQGESNPESPDPPISSTTTTTSTTPTGSGTGKQFGPSVDCGPYFTAPIISGLVVAFTCLATLLTFIVMMMDCHTNDKYDNVNDKPLIVPSQG